MKLPEGEPNDRDNLMDSALRAYLKKTHAELKQSKSWIRQPNNFISVVAIVLSLTTVAYQIYKDWVDDRSKDLASLSTIVSDLTKVDSEQLTAKPADADKAVSLGINLNNRRIALLAEAGRLVAKLGADAPRAQLAVLGADYFQIGDLDTAIKDFRLLTQPPASLYQRASAWRSIGYAYALGGPKHYDDARQASAEAARVYRNSDDTQSVSANLDIQEHWAALEGMATKPKDQLGHLQQARMLLNEMPCIPDRVEALADLDKRKAAAMIVLKQADASAADEAERAWTQVIAADRCPTAPPAAPAVTSASVPISAVTVPPPFPPATPTPSALTIGKSP